MRRANGTGSVYKLSGKRRKPWIVRITDKYEIVDGKAVQKCKTVGYYATRKEAETALGSYLADPYDLRRDSITFEEVYDKWSDEHFETLSNQSAIRSYKSAFSYFSSIHKKEFAELRVAHLEGCIKDADVGKATKGRMKSLINQMYQWAMKNEIVKVDYAHMCDSVKQGKPDSEGIPFKPSEIKLLWNNINIPFVDMILIGIYSGWRPQELSIIKIKDIREGFVQGGLKTDEGRNRVVPIHKAVESLVNARIKEAEELHSEYLFNDPEGQQGTHMTYDKYRGRFTKVMKRLKLEHKPHDTRRTFITYAKRSKMDEYLVKKIVGHKDATVTALYTYETLEQLREEMDKYTIPEKDELFIMK